jgi:glycerol kinase
VTKYILALDQGTTSSRSILFDRRGRPKATAQKEFKQILPKSGWVEHDPLEIWQSQKSTLLQVLKKQKISSPQIAAIGITNQRETTVVWNRKTGKPIYNAIVWQDRRTAEICEQLKKKGLEPEIRKRTGLLLDPYFSATKLQWILDHVPGARHQAQRGELAFGTIDSWLIWNLTRGQLHVTDASNASRTMLLNLKTSEWDERLLKLFRIPRSILPQVCDSSGVIGAATIFNKPIPISGIAGDQQAALFGQVCTKPGMVKNTYGTGCFILMNTGSRVTYSKNRLLSTIGWRMNSKIEYALEGSVFVAGAAVQWLRDGLKIIPNAEAIEKLVSDVSDSDGVYFVPALTGLGAPHWDPYARGLLIGISRRTTTAHIARAALEGIAFQVCDVLNAMERDSGIRIRELRVDGGASQNDLLMQIQADLLGTFVIRPQIHETTALGAAYLAGLGMGFWNNIAQINRFWRKDRLFKSRISKQHRTHSLRQWNHALSRSRHWETSNSD